jgi:hypothetical protein
MEDASIQVTFSSTTSPNDLEKHFAVAAKSVEKEKERMFKALYDIALSAAESKVHIHTGALRDSLKAGHRHSASFVDSSGFALGSNLPYARVQDNAKRWGIKPTWPNVTALRSWVSAKVVPVAEGPASPTLHSLDALTYLIGRKLANTSPKPTNYLEYAATRVRLRMEYYSDKMAKNLLLKLK